MFLWWGCLVVVVTGVAVAVAVKATDSNNSGQEAVYTKSVIHTNK